MYTTPNPEHKLTKLYFKYHCFGNCMSLDKSGQPRFDMQFPQNDILC